MSRDDADLAVVGLGAIGAAAVLRAAESGLSVIGFDRFEPAAPVLWPGRDITDYLAVFPIAPGTTPGLKVMGEQFHSMTAADEVDRTISDAEVGDLFERLVSPRLRGVRPRCLRRTVCLYTSTPTDDFLIDADPRSDRITIVSPCSGHGFKHSAAIGEALAQVAAGSGPTVDLTAFGRSRFTGLRPGPAG